eukprot:4094056-Amphidinium_carterae.1
MLRLICSAKDAAILQEQPLVPIGAPGGHSACSGEAKIQTNLLQSGVVLTGQPKTMGHQLDFGT